MEFHEATLPNGLKVVAELSPHVHSVAVGYFVFAGARDERPEESGVSHFLEHMAFKGNDRYSPEDVNRIFDDLGAKYNAATSEEMTMFYAAVLPEYFPGTFDLLSAIVRPSLRQSDFDVEKQVILEEIGMYDDQPSFIAYDKAMQTHFQNHPLGNSILGTTESVSALTADQMRQYHDRSYQAGNILLAIAGNSQWDQVIELATRHCSAWPAGQRIRNPREAKPQNGKSITTKESSLLQHVMQLSPAPPATHSLRFAAELLSVIVGDDCGSRLYWDLVDPGHVETAEVGYHEFDGSGVYLTYFCSPPETVKDNSDRVRHLFDRVNQEGVSEIELDQAKNKVSSRIVLRSERPMGRLGSLGSNWFYRGTYRTVRDDLAAIRSVSSDDIRKLLNDYPIGQLTTSTVGPLTDFP